MPKKKSKRRASTTSAKRLAARVATAMRAAAKRGSYGTAIANKAIAESLGSMTRGMYGKKKTRRRSKKRPSPAQLRARRAFAARAKARAKTGMAGRMRAGTRYNPRTATKKEKALYARALRVAKAAPKKKTGRKPAKKRGAQRSVTAAQVIAMAKKGALQKWLCQGRKRTGCGSSGRVVAGKGRFVRLR